MHVSDWGENTCTSQLCANCHELYHLAYNCYDHNLQAICITNGKFNNKSAKVFFAMIDTDKARTGFIIQLVQYAKQTARTLSMQVCEQVERGEV